jgi:hypothetical protein
MKLMMLSAVCTTLLLGACASWDRSNENVTEIPAPNTGGHSQVPAESSRKIPVDQLY